jgi:hypothetical protein
MRRRENCYVMAFDELHRQICRDGYLVIKNRRFTLRELIPDGLHLSEVAGQELMDRLERLFRIDCVQEGKPSSQPLGTGLRSLAPSRSRFNARWRDRVKRSPTLTLRTGPPAEEPKCGV